MHETAPLPLFKPFLCVWLTGDAALVLSCAGVSREDIIRDYAMSRQILLTEHLKSVVDQTGLRGEFLEAPSEVMEATLTYLDRKYGSVSNYLTSIGFGPERQARVRRLLSSNL
jgi:protein-tyrosine phosphatase